VIHTGTEVKQACRQVALLTDFAATLGSKRHHSVRDRSFTERTEFSDCGRLNCSPGSPILLCDVFNRKSQQMAIDVILSWCTSNSRVAHRSVSLRSTSLTTPVNTRQVFDQQHCISPSRLVPAVTVWTSMWEMLLSNLGWDTGYRNWNSLWFSSILSVKCPDSASIMPRSLPSKSCPIQCSLIILAAK
jgi:hypothetical protein